MAPNLNPIKIIHWLLHPSSRIQQRVAHAAVWSFGSRFGERLIEYGRLIILARLLAPQDFGLMGVGLIALSAMESLTEPGLIEGIIQKKGKVEKYLDILWTVTLGRWFLVAALLALLSPVIARFFDAPDARLILLAVAGAALLNGFLNSGVVLLQKDLEFHKVSIGRILPLAIASGVSIGFALVFHNVWALVLGLTAKNLATVAVSYWIHPYRPRLSRRIDRARELFTFSRWIYLHRVANFVSNQADSIMLGGALGTVNLGIYQMAQRTSIMPIREIPRSLSQVAFPMYSRIQQDLDGVRKAFLGTLEATVSMALPLSIIVLLLADEIVVFVLGEKWIQAAPAMRILALAGFINGFTTTGGALFAGVGKPWINLQLALFRAVVVVSIIFPMTRSMGLEGAAYTVLIGSAAGFLLYAFHSFRILRIKPWTIVRALAPAALATTVTTVIILGFSPVLQISSLPSLLAVIAIAGLVYISIYTLLAWKTRSGLFMRLMPKLTQARA
ncbi:MAG: lipopolysaccharide biosynthesis protein [Chloroflexi bacterium]|nr:lipopolysaccharide biosynthesis protein [Chloroflexota bacterium]